MPSVATLASVPRQSGDAEGATARDRDREEFSDAVEILAEAGVVPVSATVRILLAKDRGVSEIDSATLRMIVERGHYADRSVTYFRVFDPEAAARAKVEPRRYGDLDTDLVLHAGHVEWDGAIVLNLPPSPSLTKASRERELVG
jgi:hypothetical protein